ncbi:hypothetical protein LTR16_009721, partial [Cryomyces antarcticus]
CLRDPALLRPRALPPPVRIPHHPPLHPVGTRCPALALSVHLHVALRLLRLLPLSAHGQRVGLRADPRVLQLPGYPTRLGSRWAGGGGGYWGGWFGEGGGGRGAGAGGEGGDE